MRRMAVIIIFVEKNQHVYGQMGKPVKSRIFTLVSRHYVKTTESRKFLIKPVA
ncbi:MAG: hypothetical protein HFJ06_11585 [Lachnospiraceae bacterium]|nr:hypothetical protein [Lachnospiraceae bacterium]